MKQLYLRVASWAKAHKRQSVLIAVALVLSPVVVYLTAPWVHMLWFDGFFMMPGAWLAVLLFVGFVAYLLYAGDKKYNAKFTEFKTARKAWQDKLNALAEDQSDPLKKLPYSEYTRAREALEEKQPLDDRTRYSRRLVGKLISLGVLGLIVLIGVLCWQHARAQVALAQETKVETLTKLPQTTQTRYLPLEVAEKCGENRLTNTRLDLGDLDPITVDGEVNWVAPRVPSKWTNKWFGKTDGIAIVKPDCSGLTETPGKMKYGEDMKLTDSLIRQLYHRNYWADIPEVYYLTNGNEIIGVAPYIRFHMDWWSLTKVPHWGGVFVVHKDGKIEDLTPAQAQKDSRLAGQRIYPEELARKVAKAWGHRHGVFNAWFVHRDQVKVPDIDDTDNEMPYLLPRVGGSDWVTSFEPHSKGRGIHSIMFTDAQTGAVKLYKPPAGWYGPNRSTGYLRTKYPTIRWSANDKGDFLTLEPRPVVTKRGKLLWMISVTNGDYANVSWTGFVDATTGNVTAVCKSDKVQPLLNGTYAGTTARDCEAAAEGFTSGEQPVPSPSSSAPSQPKPAPTGDLASLSLAQLQDRLRDLDAADDRTRTQRDAIIAELFRRQPTASPSTPGTSVPSTSPTSPVPPRSN